MMGAGAMCCPLAGMATEYATVGEAQAARVEANKEPIDRLGVLWKVSNQDKANAAKAWKIISDYNKKLAKTDRKLYVVYVTFKGRPALADYKDRYDRILKNIQAYYYDQMRANGFPGLTFALDLDENGKLKVYEAYVDKTMEEVTKSSSGNLSREAAKKVLAEHGIDADKNHILVVCQLPDGLGPYYGSGSLASGTGWTCDQEGLDTKNFKRTDYFGGRYKVSYGRNSTIYIGGTAHELGHSFGLPHTRQNSTYPREKHGTSLMGSGNHVYGNELRKEGNGAFLAPTDAIMLASVPLFRGAESGVTYRYVGGDIGVSGYYKSGDFTQVEATSIPFGMKFSGKVKLDPNNPVYAVIARLNPPGNNDYDTVSVADVPEADGSFSLNIDYPGHSGFIDVTIYIQHADGTRYQLSVPTVMSKEGIETRALRDRIIFYEVIAAWDRMNLDRAKVLLEHVKKAYANDPNVQTEVKRWEDVLNRRSPVLKDGLAYVPDSVREVLLTEYKPAEAKSGWNGPNWNHMAPSLAGLDAFLENVGMVENYIMNHAPGLLVYDLKGKWQKLAVTLGVPCGKNASVVFEICGDGKSLFKSKMLSDGESVSPVVNVMGIQKLEIRLLDGGNGNHSDWGLIVKPRLSR